MEKIIRRIIIETCKYHLKKGFKKWGIDRTMEKVKEIYDKNPLIIKYFQIAFKELLKKQNEISK